MQYSLQLSVLLNITIGSLVLALISITRKLAGTAFFKEEPLVVFHSELASYFVHYSDIPSTVFLAEDD